MGPGRVFARDRVGLGAAAFEVGGHRDIHLLRMGQPQVPHVAGEIAFAGLAAETRVEPALLADTGDGQPAVIVGGIEQARIGQAEDLLAHRAEHRTRITLLEVGPLAAETAIRQAVRCFSSQAPVTWSAWTWVSSEKSRRRPSSSINAASRRTC